ncbi:MAG: group II intron reverse transcriptase/maturase [Betaproteobacteria bacterium]|nr:group II intron reverse transcriptase/maturase [Betaproteobacteria bacterium]
MMHEREKSDPFKVAQKPANNPGQPGAEPVERREGAEGNAVEPSTHRTLSRASVSQRLDRVRQAAKAGKKERFTALLHHVSVELLKAAYSWLKRDAAPGVDQLTWKQYGQDLEANVVDLHARVHRGAYRALPSRRHYIAKADGRQRPLGIAALEDKIVQRALVEVLNAIYEEDFLGFSYGFRPGRGQHDCLDALAVGITRTKVNWVLDADIGSFFDSLSHSWLVRFVEHRIGDPRVIRLIGKWLKAGVMEDGVVKPTAAGTPQGAVASPLLANLYLHYVFDLWARRWRERHARGQVIFVRYADDIVAGFEHEAEARRFMADLRVRMEQFALTLHPEKTRLIEFGRVAAERRVRRGLGKPETFNFLGFTHICGRSQSGTYQLQRKSRRDRMRATLREIKEELRRRRHDSIPEQGRWLGQVVRGYFNYHAVPTNNKSLSAFRHHVSGLWRRALQRRSQKDRTTWARVLRLAAHYLPAPQPLHPWPAVRFAVTHPRWEPGARIAPAGICAGGAG